MKNRIWKHYSLILIPGVPKCGTSSMFSDIVQYEEVIAHQYKEINLPLDDEIMREQWFPKVNPNGLERGTLIDASQNYCWDIEHRDLEYLGGLPFRKIKVILMFRNPIFRSASNYEMNRKQHGWKDAYSVAWKDYVTEKGQQIMGDYWEFYQRNNRIFGPQNVKVVISEHYFAERLKILDSVGSFLGCNGEPSTFKHEIISPMNEGPSSYHLDSPMYNELKAFFTPYVKKFESGLNLKTTWLD